MANKLKNLRLTSVDMVRNGANQEADICLFKSEAPTEDPAEPTTEEKGIFKKFVDWFRKGYADEDLDGEDTIEKDYSTFGMINSNRENNEKLWRYTDALTCSIRSILEDHDLAEEERLTLMQKSLGEFDIAMEQLFASLCKNTPSSTEEVPTAKSADTMDDSFYDLEKSDYDEIEEV